jgi:hypothetical protein
MRREGGHAAAIVALVALVAAAVAWWWTTHQPLQPDAGLGMPHAVIVIGGATFVLALLAQIRAMSFMDVLELLWSLVLGVFGLIGMILRGIWSFICGLFGWN